MSAQPLLPVETPRAAKKPHVKMISTSLRVKAMVVTFALMLGVYFLLTVATSYVKTKRLDRIMEMAIETEKQMLNVRRLDQTLAVKIAQLDNLFY